MVGTLTVIIQVKHKGRPSLMTWKLTKTYQFIKSFITGHNLLNESILLRADMFSKKGL